jgi:hypothetical protein
MHNPGKDMSTSFGSYALKVSALAIGMAILGVAFRWLGARHAPEQATSLFVVFGLPLLIGVAAQLLLAATAASTGSRAMAYGVAIAAATGAWFMAIFVGLNVWGA